MDLPKTTSMDALPDLRLAHMTVSERQTHLARLSEHRRMQADKKCWLHHYELRQQRKVEALKRGEFPSQEMPQMRRTNRPNVVSEMSRRMVEIERQFQDIKHDLDNL